MGGSPWQAGGVLLAGGVGLSLAGGGALPARGGSPWQGGFSLADPPVNRMTDRYKNITLATTSLRPVIKGWHMLVPPEILDPPLKS